jgi:hypothetical protein
MKGKKHERPLFNIYSRLCYSVLEFPVGKLSTQSPLSVIKVHTPIEEHLDLVCLYYNIRAFRQQRRDYKVNVINLEVIGPRWEMEADIYLLKLQRLENKVLRTTENFARRTAVRDLHTAFNLPFVYDYMTQLCRQQAEVTQNHEDEHVSGMGQGEARHR